MNPDNPFATVAQAVINLVSMHSHLFAGLGQHLFRGFAVIVIAWFGIKAALAASEGRGPFPMAKFAGLLMTIAFGTRWSSTTRRPFLGSASASPT